MNLLYVKLKQFCTSLRICENQKNKILSLNLSKSRILKTNCLCIIKNFMIMLRFFEQKSFCGCKSQIFVFGYWIAGRGDRAGYPVRCRMRLGDAFHWLGVQLGGHSANQEAPEVSLWGSWMLCTPSLASFTCYYKISIAK